MHKYRLLIVHWDDYYLWEFLEKLATGLVSGGHIVRVLTFDSGLTTRYQRLGIPVDLFPRYVKYAYRYSSFPLIRPVSWIVMYLWAYMNRERYDLAVLPWDNKLIAHAIRRYIKGLTIHCTTNLVDLEEERIEHLSDKKHEIAEFIERISGKSILPRFMGSVMRHDVKWYIDRIMGMKSSSDIQGFSGIEMMTVTGQAIKDNLIKAALNESRTEVRVVGNPAYEGYIEYAANYNEEMRSQFCSNLGIRPDEPLFTFFLSPTEFSEKMIRELIDVVRITGDEYSDATLYIKLHPSTTHMEASRIRKHINPLFPERIIFKKGFEGDRFNLDLIINSRAIIQKQCTLGFLAMLVDTPIISCFSSFLDLTS